MALAVGGKFQHERGWTAAVRELPKLRTWAQRLRNSRLAERLLKPNSSVLVRGRFSILDHFGPYPFVSTISSIR